MKEINRWGPAFPGGLTISANQGTAYPEPQEGMSLRDYFAAHAPRKPQHWFRPVMPERPGKPSDPPSKAAVVAAFPESLALMFPNFIENVAYGAYIDVSPEKDLERLWADSKQPQPLSEEQRAIFNEYIAACQVWRSERDAILKAQDEWRQEHERQRWVQWPYAWADAVLKAGEPRGCPAGPRGPLGVPGVQP